MARVLVTGGAGYVGSHTCKVLAKAGHEPIVYDNLSRGHREAVRWGPLEVGDLSDVTRLSNIFRRYRPDCVIHFAAFAYVGESVKDPDIYYPAIPRLITNFLVQSFRYAYNNSKIR